MGVAKLALQSLWSADESARLDRNHEDTGIVEGRIGMSPALAVLGAQAEVDRHLSLHLRTLFSFVFRFAKWSLFRQTVRRSG